MNRKLSKKIMLVIVTIILALIYFGITNKSNAAELIGIWDMSKEDGTSNITAKLYNDGSFIISGNGEMKDYENTSKHDYYGEEHNIESVKIEEGITNIGKDAFSQFINMKSIEMPNSIRRIGSYAFFNCNKLADIEIPQNVTSIGEKAFMYCYKLEDIILPIGITRIEGDTFRSSGLKNIEIPNTVTSIGSKAFFKCTNLSKIDMPNSVTKIEENTFDECINIENIKIPAGVSEIGNKLFLNCSKLYNITVDENNKYFCDIDGILYNKEKSNLIRCPQKKEQVIIPEGVNNISENAFYGCSNLTNMVIPEEIIIGKDAFSNAKIIMLVSEQSESIDLPNIINRAINSPEDVLYSNNNYELINCELINNTKLKINMGTGKKSLKIKDGNLNGLEIELKKVVKLDGDSYIVNNDLEYKTDSTIENKEIEWITLASDREEGSRLFVEFDLNLIKDYNSEKGLISYSTLKTWINKLEDAYDYFLELNPSPATPILIIEWTGVSRQIASAYASSKIVMNKEYHRATLKKMEIASEKGIINVSGTVLHEMGHKFAECSKFINCNYWGIGSEYINLIMVQYVLEKLAKENDNIVATVNAYEYCLFASAGVKDIILENKDKEFDDNGQKLSENQIMNKYLVNNYKSTIERYLSNNYAECWSYIVNKTSYENDADSSYADTLFNYTQIFDIVGKEKMKQIINKYVNNTDDIIENYDTSNKFNRFLTMMNIIKQFVTEDTWDDINDYYLALYNKYVVDITLLNSEIIMKKGESISINFEYKYNSDLHENFVPQFSSRSERIVTVSDNGIIHAENEGETKVRVKIGNEYALVKVKVVNDCDNILNIETSQYTFTEFKSKKFNVYTSPDSLSENLEWESSDENIAIVDKNGVVTPKQNGLCSINIKTTDGTNLSKKIDINIEVPIKLEKIEIKSNPKKINYTFGEELELNEGKLSLTYSHGYGTTINLQSNLVTIEGYDKNKVGKQIIKVQYEGKETVFEVVVAPITVTEVELNKEKLDLAKGRTAELEVLIKPNNATNKNFEIICSDESIATAVLDETTSKIIVTAVKQGKVIITVKTSDGNHTTQCLVNVHNNITGIEVTTLPTKTSYVKGEELDLRGIELTATYEDGTTGVIELKSDKFTGYNKNTVGEQEITVTYAEGITATFTVTVEIEKLEVEVKNYEIVKDNEIQYIEKIFPETDIETFKNDITTNGTIEIYKNNKKISDDNKLIATGIEIRVNFNNTEKKYIAVVIGDLSGNGKMDNTSLLKLARYNAKLDLDLQGAFLRATDVYKDGRYGDNKDLLKMSRVLAKIDEL